LVNSKIELFFNHFGLNLQSRPDKYVGRCPIHKGDNPAAFNYYKTGHWKCRTHQCHEKFLGTPIGLIRGMLSDGDKISSFKQTIDFICKALDTDFKDLPELEITEDLIPKKLYTPPDKHSIELLKSRLINPCPYFSKRFDQKVVAEQDIGFCNTPGKFFYKRSVVPIMDRTGEFAVACQGRSIYDKCKKCGSWHSSYTGCPKYFFPKWKTSKNFSTDMFQYNYWKARDNMGKAKTLFVTESVGNVLRFMEFGIYNITAAFGTQFSDFHKEMCLNTEATKIIYIKDGGEAGNIAAKHVKSQLGDICYIPEFHFRDDEDPASISKSRFEKDILGEVKVYL
jgi:hypothetical protein